MHEQGERGRVSASSTAEVATPGAIGSEPLLSNPVGFRVVINEIAARNPIVRQAIARRAEGWTR